MCAPDFYDVRPLVGLRPDRIPQSLHRRNQPLFHIYCRCDVHRRGERIVRRLRHVDVIVRMNWCLAPERRTCELTTAVGDHLVYIHVELRTAARHPYVQREHVMMLASEDLITGLDNQFVPLVVEPTTSMIGISSGFLQRRVRCNHLARNQILSYAEMFKRPLRLCSPQLVAWHINFPEAIGFLPDVRHLASPSLT